MKSSLTIEAVFRRTGLSAHMLRYYERIGLIWPDCLCRADTRRAVSLLSRRYGLD